MSYSAIIASSYPSFSSPSSYDDLYEEDNLPRSTESKVEEIQLQHLDGLQRVDNREIQALIAKHTLDLFSGRSHGLIFSLMRNRDIQNPLITWDRQYICHLDENVFVKMKIIFQKIFQGMEDDVLPNVMFNSAKSQMLWAQYSLEHSPHQILTRPDDSFDDSANNEKCARRIYDLHKTKIPHQDIGEVIGRICMENRTNSGRIDLIEKVLQCHFDLSDPIQQRTYAIYMQFAPSVVSFYQLIDSRRWNRDENCTIL